MKIFSLIIPFLLAALSAANAQQNRVIISFDKAQTHCITTKNNPTTKKQNLYVGACTDPSAQFVLDNRAQRIRSASNTNLCISDFKGMGVDDPPFLINCKDKGVDNTYYKFIAATNLIVSVEIKGAQDDVPATCLYAKSRVQNGEIIMSEECEKIGKKPHNLSSFTVSALKGENR